MLEYIIIYTLSILTIILLLVLRHQRASHTAYIVQLREKHSKQINILTKQNMDLKNNLNRNEDFIRFCFNESKQVIKQLWEKYETKLELGGKI